MVQGETKATDWVQAGNCQFDSSGASVDIKWYPTPTAADCSGETPVPSPLGCLAWVATDCSGEKPNFVSGSIGCRADYKKDDQIYYNFNTKGSDFCGNGTSETTGMVWDGKVCDNSGNIQWEQMKTVSGKSSQDCESTWSRGINTVWNDKYMGSCGVVPTYPDAQLPINVSGLTNSDIVNSF